MRCSALFKKGIAVIVAVVFMTAQIPSAYASFARCTVNAQCLAAHQPTASQPMLLDIRNAAIKQTLAGIDGTLEKIKPYVKDRKRSFQIPEVKKKKRVAPVRNLSFYTRVAVFIVAFFSVKLFLSLLGIAPSFSEVYSQQTEDTEIVIPGFPYTLSDTLHYTNDTTYKDELNYHDKYIFGLFMYSSDVYIFTLDGEGNYLDIYAGPVTFDGNAMKLHTVRDTAYIEVYNSENPENPDNVWYEIYYDGSLAPTTKPSDPEEPEPITLENMVYTVPFGDHIFGLHYDSTEVQIFTFAAGDSTYRDISTTPVLFDANRMMLHTVNDTSYLEVYMEGKLDDPGNLWYEVYPDGSLAPTSKPADPEEPVTIDNFPLPIVSTLSFDENIGEYSDDFIFGLHYDGTGIQIFTFAAGDSTYLGFETDYVTHQADSMKLITVEDSAYIELYLKENPEGPRLWYFIHPNGILEPASNPVEPVDPETLTLDNFPFAIVHTVPFGDHIFGLHYDSTEVHIFTFAAEDSTYRDISTNPVIFDANRMMLHTVHDTSYLEVYMEGKLDDPDNLWYEIYPDGSLALTSKPAELMTLGNFPHSIVHTVAFGDHIFGLHYDGTGIQVFTFAAEDSTYRGFETNKMTFDANTMNLHTIEDAAYLEVYLSENPDGPRLWYLINSNGSVMSDSDPYEPEELPTLGNFPYIIVDTVYYTEADAVKYIFGLHFRYEPIPGIRIFTFDADGYCIDSTGYVNHISNSMELVTEGDSVFLETYLENNPSYARKRFLVNTDNGNVTLPDGTPITGIEDVSFGVATESITVFPNPISGVGIANISYEVVETGTVSIVVYDQSGRPVQTIVSEMQYPGEYTVQWDANRVSQGMYFVRITVDNKPVATKKVVKASSSALVLLMMLFGLTGKNWKSILEPGSGNAIHDSEENRRLRIYLDRQIFRGVQPQQEVPVSFAQLEESGLLAHDDLMLFAHVAYELDKEDDILSDEVVERYLERKVVQMSDEDVSLNVIFFDSDVDDDVTKVQKGIQASSLRNKALVVTTKDIFEAQEGVRIMSQELNTLDFEHQPEHRSEKRLYFKSAVFNGNIAEEMQMFKSA